jgi:hypothetical protein
MISQSHAAAAASSTTGVLHLRQRRSIAQLSRSTGPIVGRSVLSGFVSSCRASSAVVGLRQQPDVEASGLGTVQPRRVGTAINMAGPVWRSEHAMYVFSRQSDGTLALHLIDPTSGAVRDLGVRLPAGTGQGVGLAARWDTCDGDALLLSQSPNGGTGGASLQAWLVSFVSPSSAAGVAH